ncbi:MAG: membrane protein insertion efficiency factor YidD [bacterium]
MEGVKFWQPRFLPMVAIRFYQRLVSPDHSRIGQALFPDGYCRYWPSCSEYGFGALRRYGLLKGSVRTAWRVMRCNPWSAGGVDEVD